MSRFYVCESQPYVRVYDREDRTVELLSENELKKVLSSNIEVDGLSKGGVSVSEQSKKFRRNYRLRLVKGVLSEADNELMHERRNLFCIDASSTGLIPQTIDGTRMSSDYYINLSIMYDKGDKYLCICVETLIAELYVECNSCDEFLSSLEDAVNNNDLERTKKLVLLYFKSFKNLVSLINKSHGVRLIGQPTTDLGELIDIYGEISGVWY